MISDPLSFGLLIIRVVAGLTLAAHGAQKLFGWFGGPGFAGTIAMQQKMGFKPPLLWAVLVIMGDVCGGLSIALGFFTPLCAERMLGAMLMAIVKVHWSKGFFSTKGGFEFPLALLAIAIGVGLAGPGRYALDSLFGIVLPSPLLFGLLAVGALIVDVVGLLISRPSAVTHRESPSRAT
jgi:putative oxidoreductase